MTDLRPFAPHELIGAFHAIELAFGGGEPHAEDAEIETSVVDPERTLGAFDGDTVIATAGWYDFAMTVPGAVAPMAGVTWVSVSPVHRRRGLLSAMMTRQLLDLREAERPLAALWASEAAIYQRFGYGPGSWMQSLKVKRGAGFNRPVDVSGLRLEQPSGALLAATYDAARAVRPGWFARDERWWSFRLYDPSHRREGGSALRCVVDGTDGYALYSTKQAWGEAGSEGTVRVRELVALTPESEARLWRYLLDLDLMGQVSAWGLAVDSPLLQLLHEPRAAQARVSDALWVRLVDVSGLALRRYSHEVDVVLEVSDATCPWNAGTWRLSGGRTGAVVARTTDVPDLALDVRELGAAFLGGTSLVTRARAGFVEELSPGALVAASQAFGWAGPAAHCPMVF